MYGAMKNRINRLVVGLLLLLPLGAGAQTAARHSVELAWSASVPLGNAFLDRAGATAGALRYEYRFAPQWAAGGALGMEYISVEGLFEGRFNGDMVTGYTERSQRNIPVMASLRWYPLGVRTSLLRPYAGAGAGVQWTRFDITGETINTSRADSWGFAASAEVGMRIHPWREGAFFLDVRVAWRYATNAWKAAETERQHAFTPALGLGVAF